MILKKVRIQNFKSIIDTGLLYFSTTDLIKILAGQNESGKTSFLKALKFFQDGILSDDDRRMDVEPRVDCLFSITDEEYHKIVTDMNVEIANYFKENGINFFRESREESGGYELRCDIPTELGDLMHSYNLQNENALPANAEEETSSPIFQFIGNDDICYYFISIKPDFVFYSSFSENILPGKITLSEIENKTNQAVMDFEQIYDVNFSELLKNNTNDQKRTSVEERIRAESSDSLNQYWKQKIQENAEYHYSISIKPDSNTSQSYVNFFIKQGEDAPLSLSQKSSGFRWFTGFNLRLRAHEKAMKKNGIVLLIDEPGQNLHEVAQQNVKNILEELAQYSKMQIIYSTHQPILLGEENIDFGRLFLVGRTVEQGSKFYTISQLTEFQGNKDTLQPIKNALGLVSISSLPKKKLNVITEGITDYFYLKSFVGDKYNIIPSNGVDQIGNLYGILLGWEFQAKIILDGDAQGEGAFKKIKKNFFGDGDGDEDEETINRTIYKLPKKGIEELLSQTIISSTMLEFGIDYNEEEEKSTNVNRVGKVIFAKNFFDKYSQNIDNVDKETRSNFETIKEFLEK